MGLFSHETKEERFIKKQMKLLEDKTKRTLVLAEYSGSLQSSKSAFDQTIRTERLNALERRERQMGDSMQKQMIHDASVGLLAIQEAEFELRSLYNLQELGAAQKQIDSVLRKMYRINHYLSINGKMVKNSLGMEFDDTNAEVDFSSRAELVDENFVERLIQGATFEECLKKVNNAAKSSTTSAGLGGGMNMDFSVPAGEDYNKEADFDMLRKDADKF